MKVLITGGSGFIGRNLVEKLPKGYEIMAPNSRELDLTSSEMVEGYIKEKAPDVVIHSAVWNPTVTSKKDTGLVLEKNLQMFFNLVRVKDHFSKMIYYGSGAEYDRDHYMPRMREDYFDTHVPRDQYGFSKYVMAKYAGEVEGVFDLRLFGCFGPSEDWEIRFISNALCKAIHGLPITIRQNVSFDYTWIDDVVRITDWFIRNEPKHRHYNACTGRSIDLVSLAKIIRNTVGTEVPIVVGKEGMKAEYSGDNSRLLDEMKEMRFTSIEEAIGRLKCHYQENICSIDRNLLLIDKC